MTFLVRAFALSGLLLVSALGQDFQGNGYSGALIYRGADGTAFAARSTGNGGFSTPTISSATLIPFCGLVTFTALIGPT